MTTLTPTTCSVEGCDKPRYQQRFLCSTHAMRLHRYGSLEPVEQRHPCLEDHPAWKGNEAGYVSVHHRLRRQRGRAADLVCVDCGDSARDWSYIHDCPDERIDDRCGAFCHHLDCYVPRCKPCHVSYDDSARALYTNRLRCNGRKSNNR